MGPGPVISAIMVAALLLLSAVSRIARGVSLRAQSVAWFLRRLRVKESYDSPELARLHMRRRGAQDGEPLTVPPLLSKVTEATVEGFPVYRIEGDAPAKNAVVLYLHGGSYVDQPLLMHWTFLDRLARKTGVPVLLAVYPKAPKHHYEAAYDFVRAVYEMLLEAGYTDITVMGDSAGGGFALGFAMWLHTLGRPVPRRLVLISPWIKLTMDNPEIPAILPYDPMLSVDALTEMGHAWAGGAPLSDPRLSPIYGDLQGLPETLLLVGTHEILLPDARAFHERAKAENAPLWYREYPRMKHVFPLHPIPEAKRALCEIAAFLAPPRPDGRRLRCQKAWRRSPGG